jgi:hypothetical protein
VLQQVEAWFLTMRRLDTLAPHERLLFVAAADWLYSRGLSDKEYADAIEVVELLPEELLESLLPSLVDSLQFQVDVTVSEPPSDIFAGGLPHGAYLRDPPVPVLPEPPSERPTVPQRDRPTVPSPARVRHLLLHPNSSIPASSEG